MPDDKRRVFNDKSGFPDLVCGSTGRYFRRDVPSIDDGDIGSPDISVGSGPIPRFTTYWSVTFKAVRINRMPPAILAGHHLDIYAVAAHQFGWGGPAHFSIDGVTTPDEYVVNGHRMVSIQTGDRIRVSIGGTVDGTGPLPYAVVDQSPASGQYILSAIPVSVHGWQYDLLYSISELALRLEIVPQRTLVQMTTGDANPQISGDSLARALTMLQGFGVSFRQLNNNDVVLETPTALDQIRDAIHQQLKRHD